MLEGSVAYDEGAVVGRLVTLGAEPDCIAELFHYVRPIEPMGTALHRDDLDRLITRTTPTLAILDGITEAMTLHGLNPLDNTDTAKFGRMLPRRIAKTGAAVANLDHVTKDRDGRSRYALGAVHKLNGLDGAAYVLENRTPFGIGIKGRSTIKIAKDRPGQLRKHGLPSSGAMHWYGDLILDSQSERLATAWIEAPTEQPAQFRPTRVMAKISAALDKHGELSMRRIQAAVGGKSANNRLAIDCLILDGYVSERSPHELLRPYFEEDQ